MFFGLTITTDENHQTKTRNEDIGKAKRRNESTGRKHRKESDDIKDELGRKYGNEAKELTNRTSAFGLLRISYGDEHWRSEIPGIEATEQNERTSFKPNYKGWVAKRPTNSLSGLDKRPLRIPQETLGTLGNEATVRTGSSTRGPFFSVPKTNFLNESPSLFASLFERKRNRTKPNQLKLVVRTKAKTPVRL